MKVYLTGFIFGSHMKAFGSIFEWQIEQDKIGKVLMKINKDKNSSDKDERDIIAMFNAQNIDVDIVYTDEMIKSKRSKRIFMIQNLK